MNNHPFPLLRRETSKFKYCIIPKSVIIYRY